LIQHPVKHSTKIQTNEVHAISHSAIAAVGLILLLSYVRKENYLAYIWFSRE